jgi:hypothetical protein
VNNEYGKGFFAVFDPNNANGQSPHTDDFYSCPDLEAGTQLAYLLFPRSDVEKDVPTDGIIAIDPMDSGGVRLTNERGKLIFELNPDLSVQFVTFSNTFRQMHNEARTAGLVDSVLDEEYRKRLMEGVRYYQAGEWVKSNSECPERP